MENQVQWVNPLIIAMFNSYVELPDGNSNLMLMKPPMFKTPFFFREKALLSSIDFWVDLAAFDATGYPE